MSGRVAFLRGQECTEAQTKRWLRSENVAKFARAELKIDGGHDVDGTKLNAKTIKAWRDAGVTHIVVGISAEKATKFCELLGDWTPELITKEWMLQVMLRDCRPEPNLYMWTDPTAAAPVVADAASASLPAAAASASHGTKRGHYSDDDDDDDENTKPANLHDTARLCQSWLPSGATAGIWYYGHRLSQSARCSDVRSATSIHELTLPGIEHLNISYERCFLSADECQRLLCMMKHADVSKHFKQYTRTYSFVMTAHSRVAAKRFIYSQKMNIENMSVGCWEEEGGSSSPKFNEFSSLLQSIASRLNDRHKDELDKYGQFNFVLVQLYKDEGDEGDCLSWHRDTNGVVNHEGSDVHSGQIKDSPVASLSVGAERDFAFCRNPFNPERKDWHIAMRMPSGCLLTMMGSCNRDGTGWYHALLKAQPELRRPAPEGAWRLNLTFRVAPVS